MAFVYERIYNKLKKLGVLDVKEAATIKSGAFMDLHIDKLGENHYALSHYYRQGGDSIADPDMEIRIIPDMKMAEALTYQDTYGYRVVYPTKDTVDLRAKKDLNTFLNKWLTNLTRQGFKYKK